MSHSHLELACFDIESTRLAAKCGASRIELCAKYEIGGITPDIEAEALHALKAELGIPIFIMIRPRGGAFQYSNEEFQTMRRDITRLRDGADGFVFGVLRSDNSIDLESNRVLVSDASGKPCTMHRAFDETPDLIVALEEVIGCGFTAVLTSGGAAAAASGVVRLKTLVEKAQGRISIIAGGGIRGNNIEQIGAFTGAQWFHSAARGAGPLPDEGEIVAMRSKIEAR